VRQNLTHLQRLEAESIHILREVVAEVERPVMMYSISKDSAVMLHLAKKAFYPSWPPLPLLHVDTTWKFHDMYALRERAAREAGKNHRWNPKQQRPELWNLYNAQGARREHSRRSHLQLDRARHLTVHPPREDRDRAALLLGTAPDREARRPVADDR
jgi:3'-phosphoadenosine 5'-phosphosulfate sulfotransferase (PAPS reductase)/FAD synthetase